MTYAFTDSGNNPVFGGGAAYPGLGAPISEFGYSGGQPSLGPYAMLSSQSQSGSPAGQLSGGNAQAQSFLSGVLNGTNLPYGQQQQTAMLGQASAMNAASEAAQNKLAMANATAGGASPTDPSLQSSMAQRQNQNQNAAGNIAAQAGSANFNAQQGAAGGLLQNGIQQQELGLQAQGMANQQRNTAMGYLNGMYRGGGSGSMGLMGNATGFSQPTGDGWGM